MGLAVDAAPGTAANPRDRGDGAMATITRARLGRLGAAVLGVLCLCGVSNSPAQALSRTGVIQPGGPIVVQDPCMPQPQVISFSAAPSEIPLGASANVSWSVQVPAGCSYTLTVAGQSVPLQGALPLQGTVADSPIHDTTYTLKLAWGPSQALWVTATTQIIVDLPVDPDDPTRKKVVITNPPLLDLFFQGLATPNTTVVVDNAVQLDLSAWRHIYLAEGVRLVGGRTVVPGKPFQPGPRLFTTSMPDRLFVVGGPRVRITGLRIQGHLSVDPPGIANDDADSSIGISIAFESRGPVPVEIDHNEIYGWSNAGIEVLGKPDWHDIALPTSFDPASMTLTYGPGTEPAYIHDNYIHNNLHAGKLGYGVVVGDNGSHALIERNVFDWNRHAISGDGSDFSGYRAYRNLVLSDGGNDTWLAGVWHYTHEFDMHGQSSYCLNGFADRDCGTAGHDIDIQQNTFLYTAGTDIKVRGTPQMAAVIKSNVFAHDSIGDAIDWTETGVFVGNDNRTGVTPSAIDYCDFDGDGLPDRFLTTGQTWWFSSNRGTGPWIFLNASSSNLQDVTLGYFDGDNLCDVIAGGVTYSGGTPQPPQRLGGRTVPAKARLLLGQ